MEHVTVLGPVQSYQTHNYVECICDLCGHLFVSRSGRVRGCPECDGVETPDQGTIASRAAAIRATWSYKTALQRKGGEAVKQCSTQHLKRRMR